MTTALRTRADILAELAVLTHQAGRMTIVSPGYEPTHDEINALLTELEACG